MTVTYTQLAVYALAMFGLWAVPGPVWLGLIARTLSGGIAAAWPLAIGVAIGDLFWPLSAILGLSWLETIWGDFLSVLRWVAAVVFVVLGLQLLRKPAMDLTADGRLTKPGMWPGITIGVALVLGNPKAILFYMGALPGFFALDALNWADIGAIIAISAVVPMLGNMVLALFLDRARRLVSSPEAMRRMNIGSGILLILVGAAIPFL